MKPIKTWYVILPMLLLASACSRPGSETATFRFKTPGHPDMLSSSSGAPPTFCYLVNVFGGGLPITNNSCAPSQGVSSGFVPPETLVEVALPKGSGRTVEVYGYLAPAGQTCSVTKSLADVPLNRLFRMGSREGIDMSGDVVDVTISAIFPGVNRHYGITGGLSSSCYAGLTPLPVEAAGAGSPVQVGQQYVIKSRLGSSSSQVLSGSSYKITGSGAHVVQ